MIQQSGNLCLWKNKAFVLLYKKKKKKLSYPPKVREYSHEYYLRPKIILVFYLYKPIWDKWLIIVIIMSVWNIQISY
jgi:hypothetical protein